MKDSAIRYCINKVALVIELVEEFDYDIALEELDELVLFLTRQLLKKEAEG